MKMTLCYLITVAFYFHQLQFSHACNTMPPVCKTLDYKTCKFPFVDGITKYENCALHSTGKYWCAVSGGSWGYCNMKTCSAQETQPSDSCPLPTKPVENKPNKRVVLKGNLHRFKSKEPTTTLNPHTWHLVWDAGNRIPLLSYFHKSGANWELLKDGQSIPRGSNGFILPTSGQTTAPNVPSEDGYTNTCNIRHGHLLSSDFLRTYLTIARSTTNCRATVKDINNLQRNMINIFPQYKSCNEGATAWTHLESQYMTAAVNCMMKQDEFEIIHSVEESTIPFMAAKTAGIQMVDAITVCYRCSQITTFAGTYTCGKIENLANPAGCSAAAASTTLYSDLVNKWNAHGIYVPALRTS